jgi:choline dehydrogenase-like flavoprotein
MTDKHDCIVIGSGPSGVAAASALLAAGRHVHMLDVGVSLEPERERKVSEARGRALLTPANAPWLDKQGGDDAIPRKLIFGSDFPYREASESLALTSRGTGAEPSFARGGLSNVWGAAALPFAAEDTADWPVSAESLAPHYEACARILGIAGEQDYLAEWFPLHVPPSAQVNASRQAQLLLANLTHNRTALADKGLRFGRARLAANASACTYCGLCLHGCPDRLIYSANDTLAALTAHPRFSYRADAIVQSLEDGAESAVAHGVSRGNGERFSASAKRVFVAAGAIPTTALLLKSAEAFDAPARLKDSQYFVLPLVLFGDGGKTRDERLHTMAQIFLELRDAALSPYTIHLQVYTYNSLLAGMMRKRLGPLLEPLARWGDAHFVLIQGYLHSAHSGAIELTQRRDALAARGVPNREARAVIGRVVRKLMALSPMIGAFPLAPLMQIAEPGRGFHIGGSFPMRKTPAGFESDTLGRPHNWRRIHAVDASVLPSIPATTITYPVMANAHRIATEAAAL